MNKPLRYFRHPIVFAEATDLANYPDDPRCFFSFFFKMQKEKVKKLKFIFKISFSH